MPNKEPEVTFFPAQPVANAQAGVRASGLAPGTSHAVRATSPSGAASNVIAISDPQGELSSTIYFWEPGHWEVEIFANPKDKAVAMVEIEIQ